MKYLLPEVCRLVDADGLEPSTSPLRAAGSTKLSYASEKVWRPAIRRIPSLARIASSYLEVRTSWQLTALFRYAGLEPAFPDV